MKIDSVLMVLMESRAGTRSFMAEFPRLARARAWPPIALLRAGRYPAVKDAPRTGVKWLRHGKSGVSASHITDQDSIIGTHDGLSQGLRDSAGPDPDGIEKPPIEVHLVREPAGQRDLRERLRGSADHRLRPLHPPREDVFHRRQSDTVLERAREVTPALGRQ